MSYLTYSIFSYFYVSVYKVATTAALAKYTSLIIYIFGAQTTNLSTIYTVSIRYSLTYIQYFILCFIFIRIMADQQDRGLLGMFGKKHEEGSHGQPAPYTEQGGYKYGETELHHSSPQDYTYDATQVHHAPPTATYSEDIYGISKPHDKQGEEKSHGLFGKLHDKHDSSSSSSSDEEEKGGGRRKKKGLKEKIKEKLPGHHGTGNEEGEKYVGEEKKHGLFGH